MMNVVSITSSQKLVLIVDDDPLITELFGEILSELYEVRTVNSLVDAQQLIKRENIYIVISDYHFGQQDACELFSWILEINPGLAANFILLTGDKMANLNDFKSMATVLYKPVKIQILLARVEQLFQADKEIAS